ncbi:hypothetical protein T06_2752, partial [Trichinella sp. T6]
LYGEAAVSLADQYLSNDPFLDEISHFQSFCFVSNCTELVHLCTRAVHRFIQHFSQVHLH